MIFAKVDICLPTHPKFIAAGPAAVGYWTAALTYSRGHDLDGELPDHAVGVLLGVGEREGRRLAAKLVSVGLFERGKDGFSIFNYANKNETKEQVEARRAATKARVQKHREQREGNGAGNGQGNASRNAVTNPSHDRRVTPFVPGSGSDSDSDSDQREKISQTEISPARPPTLAVFATNATRDGAFGMTISAWVDGVSEVTKLGFPQPRGKVAGALSDALVQASKLFQSADECESARQAGKAYATAKRGLDLDVFDFARWIGSGAPSGPRKPVERDPEREARDARERRNRIKAEVEAEARRQLGDDFRAPKERP